MTKVRGMTWVKLLVVSTVMLADLAKPPDLLAANTGVLAKIGLLADPHVTRDVEGEKYIAHLKRAIGEVNAAGVDLVLIAGDLTKKCTGDEFNDFLALSKKFKVPVWSVPGNHDVGNKFGPKDGGGVTKQGVKFYEDRVGPTWFSRTFAGVRVIGINSPILGSGLGYEARQWKFLERELAHRSRTPTVVLTHYPPFANDEDEPGGCKWDMEPGQRRHLLQLLKSGGVKAVLSGHLHRVFVPGRPGIQFVTAPAISFSESGWGGWVLLTILKNGELKAPEVRRLDGVFSGNHPSETGCRPPTPSAVSPPLLKCGR